MSEKVNQIQKINKLLALSKSDNEQEAKLALLNATKLMSQYQITQSDLDRGMIVEGNKIILTRPLQKYERFIISFCISTQLPFPACTRRDALRPVVLLLKYGTFRYL